MSRHWECFSIVFTTSADVQLGSTGKILNYPFCIYAKPTMLCLLPQNHQTTPRFCILPTYPLLFHFRSRDMSSTNKHIWNFSNRSLLMRRLVRGYERRPPPDGKSVRCRSMRMQALMRTPICFIM